VPNHIPGGGERERGRERECERESESERASERESESERVSTNAGRDTSVHGYLAHKEAHTPGTLL